MSIAVEQPPASLPADAKEYLQRMLIQIAGAFENLELEVQQLEARIKTLEDA